MSRRWKLWIAAAGALLVAGGLAWIAKLWVIVATDGRVVATGAAGAMSARPVRGAAGVWSGPHSAVPWAELLVGRHARANRLTIRRTMAA
jgi:hypothetical protein